MFNILGVRRFIRSVAVSCRGTGEGSIFIVFPSSQIASGEKKKKKKSCLGVNFKRVLFIMWYYSWTPPNTHTHMHTLSSIVPYLHHFWTHMWFMMETGGNVCLLLAVLHLVTACTDRVTVQYNVGSVDWCTIPAVHCIFLLEHKKGDYIKSATFLKWINADRIWHFCT